MQNNPQGFQLSHQSDRHTSTLSILSESTKNWPNKISDFGQKFNQYSNKWLWYLSCKCSIINKEIMQVEIMRVQYTVYLENCCDPVSEYELGGVWFQQHSASYSTPKQGLLRQGYVVSSAVFRKAHQFTWHIIGTMIQANGDLTCAFVFLSRAEQKPSGRILSRPDRG